MATGTYKAAATRGGGQTERWTGASAADTALTTSTLATTPAAGPPVVRRLLYVAIAYSDTPTYTAGCTVTLNSGVGSAYDTILDTSGANAEDYVYEPTTELRILPDDAIDAVAKAGGGAITSTTTIVTEQL